MIGRLGGDLYGKQLFDRLSQEQVDMRGVSFAQDQLSGTAFINVQQDGLNTIVVSAGANATVTPEYVMNKQDVFTGAQFCLVQMEIPIETVEAIIRICREEHVRVILKPSPAQTLPKELLEGIYLFIPNREEAAQLCPDYSDPEEQARIFLRQGVEHVIITLGDQGCLYADHKGIQSYPAIEFPSVDATGASDIFISCLAAQLSQERDMNSAIRLATIAASYSVSKEGVQSAIISTELLYDLYHGDYSLSAEPKQ